MKKLIPIFLLKTDISDERIPFFTALQIYDPSGSAILPPVVEETVSEYFKNRQGSHEDTLLVNIRSDFSRRFLRNWFSMYFKQNKRFMIFICDSIQRADMVINTINDIYTQENIALYKG